ncbi:hypothetical protein [Suttonella ornithocola]|nr:hypothetical protein [Suttonella ornithocola]
MSLIISTILPIILLLILGHLLRRYEFLPMEFLISGGITAAENR